MHRTYISIAVVANKCDVLWVMSCVDHGDSKMTMDVSVQHQPRVKRDHGKVFDVLIRYALDELANT